jgi:hypothetical protein
MIRTQTYACGATMRQATVSASRSQCTRPGAGGCSRSLRPTRAALRGRAACCRQYRRARGRGRRRYARRGPGRLGRRSAVRAEDATQPGSVRVGRDRSRPHPAGGLYRSHGGKYRRGRTDTEVSPYPCLGVSPWPQYTPSTCCNLGTYTFRYRRRSLRLPRSRRAPFETTRARRALA